MQSIPSQAISSCPEQWILGFSPSFIDVTCDKLTTKRHTIAYDKDGFKMLVKLMGVILPHLDGKCLDVVTEITNIKINEGETLNSLYLQFTLLMRKLGLAKHHIPATSLINKYFMHKIVTVTQTTLLILSTIT